MARIELSAEVRAIESLIDAGEQGVASTRLQAAQPNLGRRPEYRYLICLYDAKFRVRSDTELLRDVTELVGEQPDLMEATALLAEIYARTGDEARADLFARLALESPSPSARSRALEVLKAHANDAPEPPSSHLRQVDPEPHESSGRLRAATEAAPQSSNLDAWFDRAGRERVHRRTPMYGVKASSIVEMLLAWGKSVAAGNSFISKDALPLTRDSLAVVDEAILALRRQPGQRNASKSDTSRATAAAGFFLAVVLNELEATVIEVAADDGGCKVVLPSGAGTRPLLVAAAFADGTGPSLLQTFDRLSAARELAGRSDAPFRRPSSGAMPVAGLVSRPPASHTPVPSLTPKPSAGPKSFTPRPAGPPFTARDELALTRPEVEAAPVRKLDRPTRATDVPPLDFAGIAASLARSAMGQDIAARSGSFLAPTPASVEALESYCAATRGELGVAADRSSWQPSDADEELILAWGAFLGETLIAAYGGIWECDPNAPSDPRLFRVICEDRIAAWPITLVYLRLKNGTRHNLIGFIASVGRLLAS